MKIFGIGTDIINTKRMEKTLKKNSGSFKKRVFSKNEIIYCEKKKNPTTFFAKRFAAKEALSKALGTGIRKGINFKNKIFSKSEIIYCEKKKNPFSFYAKRFAAKEALSKALGTGIRKGIDFKNIEIFNDRFGKPSITLKGTTQNFLKKKIKKGKYNIYLSLSDDKPWAQATVIISY